MKIYARVLEGGVVDAVSTIPQPDVQVEAEAETPILYLEKLKGYEVRADEETGILFMRFDEKRYQEAVKREEEAEAKAKAYAVMQLLMTQSVLDNATDEQALVMCPLYPAWQTGIKYAKGTYVNYNNVLYKVLQDHTSQETWTPDEAHSLFAKVINGVGEEEVPEWQQPDSTNPYMKDEVVRYKGELYMSLVDNNVWTPGNVGSETLWKKLESDD